MIGPCQSHPRAFPALNSPPTRCTNPMVAEVEEWQRFDAPPRVHETDAHRGAECCFCAMGPGAQSRRLQCSPFPAELGHMPSTAA
jgi:hypothetical protein